MLCVWVMMVLVSWAPHRWEYSRIFVRCYFRPHHRLHHTCGCDEQLQDALVRGTVPESDIRNRERGDSISCAGFDNPRPDRWWPFTAFWEHGHSRHLWRPDVGANEGLFTTFGMSFHYWYCLHLVFGGNFLYSLSYCGLIWFKTLKWHRWRGFLSAHGSNIESVTSVWLWGIVCISRIASCNLPATIIACGFISFLIMLWGLMESILYANKAVRGLYDLPQHDVL